METHIQDAHQPIPHRPTWNWQAGKETATDRPTNQPSTQPPSTTQPPSSPGMQSTTPRKPKNPTQLNQLNPAILRHAFFFHLFSPPAPPPSREVRQAPAARPRSPRSGRRHVCSTCRGSLNLARRVGVWDGKELPESAILPVDCQTGHSKYKKTWRQNTTITNYNHYMVDHVDPIRCYMWRG